MANIFSNLNVSDFSDAMFSFLFFVQDQPVSFGDPVGYSFFMMFLQTIFALGLVCGLAYVMFRWVLPRLSAVGLGGHHHMVRVVDRVPLDARKSLYVVEVAGRWLLISSSEAGVHIVSELEASAAEEASDQLGRERPTLKSANELRSTGRSSFADQLARLMSKKGGR